MAKTPHEVKVKVDMDHPKIRDAIKQAVDDGYEQGLQKGRQEILDYLEHAYIHDSGRPDKGTPRAEAMLQLAQEIHAHFTKKLKRGRRK